MKKILICGFPHCGTTILRSIIGHCDEVEELINETKEINSKTNKKFMLCKYPFAEKKFFEKEYDDYIKIFVIRNPIFVYSSLKKRYSDYRRIPNSHRFNKYVENLELFTYCKNNLVKSRKVFTIRYEDLFENNHENLKKILISIGINFTDDIFCNEKYKNYSHVTLKTIPNERPLDIEHQNLRTWQLNQPFISNNDPFKN